MAYTKFGEFVRILRVRNHEVMGDMATKLNVRISFLSAVENGKKNVPADWIVKLTALYGLSASEQAELKTAIEESKTQYKINLENAGLTQRKAAMQFARSFDNMDDDTAIKILKLLGQKEEN